MRKEIMNWDICMKEHILKVSIDQDKINSILKMCDIRLRFVQKQKIDDENPFIICEIYYEIIKELLIVMLLQNGLKSDNHECLISFFRNNYPQYEYEVNIISQLKNIRNRIGYDAIFVTKDYILNNRLEFEHIIKLFVNLITCRH